MRDRIPFKNPPANTSRGLIELGQGLELNKPKLVVDPGTLLDCENFEITDRGGLGRIAGYEPYDGRVDLSLPVTLKQFVGFAPGNGTVTIAVGVFLYISGATIPFGVVNAYESVYDMGMNITTYTITYVAPLDDDLEMGDLVTVQDDPDSNIMDVTSVTTITRVFTDFTVTEANQVAVIARTNITELGSSLTSPLSTRPIGLHWFRDRLYAVSNEYTTRFVQGGGAGGDELFVNQYIQSDTGAQARVLAIEVVSGDWATGDVVGFLQLDLITNFATWNISGVDFDTYTDDTFTTPLVDDIGQILNTSNGTSTLDYATLWESKSLAQATAEGGNVGWNRIDAGFELDYEEGFSESGSLVKIEKGTTPNYTTPAPVTTSATTANLLLQGKNVGGESAQVQGWKSTAADTIFAVDADAVRTDDNVFLYGDLLSQQWGLNTGGDVKTYQPSGGVGAEPTYPLGQYDPNGEALVYTTPAHSTTIRGSNGFTYFLLSGFAGLSTLIPEGARIQGIEVSAKYDAEVMFKGWTFTNAEIFTGFANVRLEAQLMNFSTETNSATKLGAPKAANLDFTLANFTEANTQTSGSVRQVRFTKDAESTVTFGDTDDLWGLENLLRGDAVNEAFTIGFRGQLDCGTIAGSNTNDNILLYRPLIDLITVEMTYITDSVRYYFIDATGNIIQGDLVYYTTVTGTFTGGDAAGTMQLINVVNHTGTKYMIDDTMDIHTDDVFPALAATKVGEVATDMVYNGLPGYQSLIENNSRYGFITANFYARDDLDGFYGVSGAGKAFSVNTFLNGDADLQEYIVKITTNSLDEPGDIPRHVAYHHYHLALGFSSGIVRFSVPGQPENFDGVLGAAEIGVGDKVTGLLEMRGMTLGVFCENSITSIAGTDAENFTTQVLAPYTGALEYTVVDMGIPMYCDSRGISTLEQSERYGNFLGERLSAPITPWILPRMVRVTDEDESEIPSIGVACAIPVRAKNHYRVFFRDGAVAVCTINPGSPPSFTFSNYGLVPLCWSSQVDDKGIERVHVGHYSPGDVFSTFNSQFVYELETGWGFAGQFIDAYFITNWNSPDPFVDKTIKNIRMDGLSYGFGSSKVSIADGYEEVYNTVSEPISLPSTPAAFLSQDLKPVSTMADVARTGLVLSIKIEDVDTDVGGIPPCIHQIMRVQYKSDGKSD